MQSSFPPRISLIAAAMMHEEGFFLSSSLARRNYNPGNLRSWPATPTISGFAHFPTPLAGYSALCQDIYTNSGLTLRAFIAKFAPPTENNTSQYLSLVCSITGFGPDELVGGTGVGR